MFHDPKKYSANRALFWCGTVLVLSGLIHLLVWPIVGGSWEGSLSIRKPILFGISAGVTTWSMGWVLGHLRMWKLDNMLSIVFSVSIFLEVAIITLQFWRSVPSHFNYATGFDSFLTCAMNVLISIVVGIILLFTCRCFSTLVCDADVATAIRHGMLLLVVGCGIGFVISAYGDARVAADLSPETYGAAGVTKFPHGMPLHAIQFLAILPWLQRHLGVALKERTRSVRWAAAGLWMATLFSAVQTLLGRARFDFSVLTFLLALASATFLVLAVARPFFVEQTYAGKYS